MRLTKSKRIRKLEQSYENLQKIRNANEKRSEEMYLQEGIFNGGSEMIATNLSVFENFHRNTGLTQYWHPAVSRTQ